MRVKRALSIVTLVATATVWLGVTAVTAPAQADQPTVAPAAAVCGTDTDCAVWDIVHGQRPHGYGIDRTELANWDCWVEKVHSAATAEVICGDKGDRPRTDTADIGEVFAARAFPTSTDATFIGDCGWVASSNADGFDIAPAGCN